MRGIDNCDLLREKNGLRKNSWILFLRRVGSDLLRKGLLRGVTAVRARDSDDSDLWFFGGNDCGGIGDFDIVIDRGLTANSGR